MELIAIKVINVINLFLAFFGIVANILSIIVLTRKNLRSSFNTILLGLTCSDILLLIKTSLTGLNNLEIIHLHLSTSPWGYKSLFLLAWLCDGGTKYFTVCVSFERFLAISHPLKARVYMTYKRSRIFAICVALFVIFLALVNFYFQFESNVLSDRHREIGKAIFLNFGPFIAICAFNFLIYLKIRKSHKMKTREITKKLEREKSRESRTSASATRMLLTVVFVFGFCYSFEFARRVMSYFVEFDIHKNNFHLAIYVLSDLFYTINSSVNFIIYILMGRKFRTEFLNLFSCCSLLKLNNCLKHSSKTSNNNNERIFAISNRIVRGDSNSIQLGSQIKTGN